MINIPLNLFVISMTATPGPANMAHLASGQNSGFKKSLPFLMGNVAGLLLMNLSVGFGIGRLVQATPAVNLALKILGTIYIVYLAVAIIRSSSSVMTDRKTFTLFDGMILQFLNPKSWAMSVAAFSQFSDSSLPLFPQIIGFSLCFLLWQPISHGLWAATGAGIMGWLEKKRARLLLFNSTASAIMVASTVYSLAS